MAWGGTFTCRRHVAADDSLWATVGERMDELLPLALGMIDWVNQQFDEQPFGLDNNEFLTYAADRAQRRLSAIESARGRSVADIDVDYSPPRSSRTPWVRTTRRGCKCSCSSAG